MLMIPDIDRLTLRLVAYRHRHAIQTGGLLPRSRHLDLTNGWPVYLGRMSVSCNFIDLVETWAGSSRVKKMVV